MPHSGPHDHGHHHDDGHPVDDVADLLDLDAEVLHAYWSQAMDLVGAAVSGRPPRRVVDLGAGTGTGAMALAQRFPAADVIAVDLSADSLRRLTAAAGARGLDGRIETLEADLDAGWPGLSDLDLTWASMSLHHLADPVRVLTDLRAATTDGGTVAVAEFSDALRFLPHDLGVGGEGFEDRVVEVLDRAHTEVLPMIDAAWATRLAAAGWTVTGERELAIDLDPPTHPEANRYAWGWFSRLSQQLGESLEPDDRATLAALVDEHGPHSLLHRTDLHIRGVRTVTLARR